MRNISLAIGVLAALGLSYGPHGVFTGVSVSESFSAFLTGSVLLSLAAVARRRPLARQ
jgi:hypothetical protein